MGTQATAGASSTILDGELDLDHLILVAVEGWCPTDTRMALRAGGAPSPANRSETEQHRSLSEAWPAIYSRLGSDPADPPHNLVDCCGATGRPHSLYRQCVAQA